VVLVCESVEFAFKLQSQLPFVAQLELQVQVCSLEVRHLVLLFLVFFVYEAYFIVNSVYFGAELMIG